MNQVKVLFNTVKRNWYSVLVTLLLILGGVYEAHQWRIYKDHGSITFINVQHEKGFDEGWDGGQWMGYVEGLEYEGMSRQEAEEKAAFRFDDSKVIYSHN